MTVQEFLELNESSIGSAGAQWDSCDALTQLNKARSALYGLDNWDGLLENICIPCCEIIRLPWFAEDVKAAYRCNRLIPIADGNYWASVGDDCCGAAESITDTGVYSPIPIENRFCSRLGIVSGDFNDSGKKLKITYQNNAGSIITDELTLDFAGFSVTETSVQKILSIHKPSTAGVVYIWSVDHDGEPVAKLFPLHPMETHIKYRQYCLTAQCCTRCTQIVLQIKKKYVPFTEEHYNFPIDFAEHALALAMQAIAEIGKRTPEGYKMYQELIRSAINYLKKNTSRKQETIGDIGLTHDYPSIA